MRTVPIPKLINLSVKRTRVILFNNFSFKKWVLLLFIAFMAGALGSGNPGSRGDDDSEKPAAPHQTKINYAIETKVLDTAAPYYVSDDGVYQRDLFAQQDQYGNFINTPYVSDINPKLILTFIKMLGIVFIIPFVILFLWLNSRFKFIWFKAIVDNDASIKEPFKQYKAEGNSLFKFYLVFILSLIIFITGLAIGAPLIFNPQEGWLNFILIILLILTVTALLIILGIYLDNFVITIMAMDHCKISGGWKKFTDIFRQNRKELALYILVLLGLNIVSVIISFLIMLICVIILVLIGLLIFGLPYLIIVSLLKSELIFIIFAVIAGIPFALLILFIFLGISLLSAVFFRSFSLYFLSSLNCGYSPLQIDEPASGQNNNLNLPNS